MSNSASMHHQQWAFVFGILGNIVSIMVCLADIYHIYKKKETGGFKSTPYLFALCSAMFWIYYAFLKTDAILLITINTAGCVMETIYITMFLIYAPKNARIKTMRILGLLNFGLFSLILILTMMLAKRLTRLTIVGWVCVAFSACVFAAPLSILRFVTLRVVLWFSYGLLLKDLYLPKIAGFAFGVLQMLMYAIYRNKKTVVKKVVITLTEEDKEHPYQENNKSPNSHDHQYVAGNKRTISTTIGGDHVISLGTLGSEEVHPIDLKKFKLY
ncbi:hypothetical protein MKW94_009767 [Papaver nudicaule]|uniref:Bidirectional sugar transporter SWEET n=1 Tax=Papaver nudicaule TaxID=74823 RepID=A0AA42AYA5_PAPNU|nr:hypothetical protein [Papaver nudicaule]